MQCFEHLFREGRIFWAHALESAVNFWVSMSTIILCYGSRKMQYFLWNMSLHESHLALFVKRVTTIVDYELVGGRFT